jgi:hypothetical protein
MDPTQTQYPAWGSGGPASNATYAGGGGGVQPHHGLIGMVVFAAAVLILLDHLGFKFAFTAGKR